MVSIVLTQSAPSMMTGAKHTTH